MATLHDILVYKDKPYCEDCAGSLMADDGEGTILAAAAYKREYNRVACDYCGHDA